MEIVVSSFSTKLDAKKFAKIAVEKKLASCASFYKVGSFYFWNSKFFDESEWVVEFKTKNSTNLFKFLEKNHPYSCPMIYVIKPVKVAKKYSNWLEGKNGGK
ncbi:MAG: divalent-cation tolerance protein CutA [Candidatus Micrarchaeota archaeon]|nr:divalent-cation tolerance protein CutA [Candidatus Micrarchaeota archaeon]